METIPEHTPYYVGPQISESSEDELDPDFNFYDAFETEPPPPYSPPKQPISTEDIGEGEFLFRCYVCGCNIRDSTSDYCLHCGTMIEKSTNTNYRECTNCNSYYLTECDAFFCNRCGNTLKPMGNEIYCLCGYMNDLTEEACIGCGYPLVFHRYNELFNHSHYTDKRTRYCYKCGIYLVPDNSESPTVLSKGSEKCLICLTNKREAAFIPCGHRCICSGCSREYIYEFCPMCRYPYKDIIKIYL